MLLPFLVCLLILGLGISVALSNASGLMCPEIMYLFRELPFIARLDLLMLTTEEKLLPLLSEIKFANALPGDFWGRCSGERWRVDECSEPAVRLLSDNGTPN